MMERKKVQAHSMSKFHRERNVSFPPNVTRLEGLVSSSQVPEGRSAEERISQIFMLARIHGHHPQKDPFQLQSQRHGNSHQPRFSWFRSPLFGYGACFLLAGVLVLLEKFDQHLPHIPIFVSTPFGLVSIMVAVIWGIGPALLSIVLGIIVITQFLSPGILSPNIAMDSIIVVPFIVMQLIAVGTVIWLERSRQQLLAAQRLTVQVNSQLEQANALKEFVLTRAAHELRTPLTTILGRTQLLSSRLEKFGATPENWAAVQKYVEVMEVRARHLQALIEDLVNLSSVYAEENPFHLTPCDLGNLCRDVIEDQQTLSGRAIELELPSDPLRLQADDKRLSQVLVNLVSNAVKYSPENTSISVRAYGEDTHVTLQIHNECPALSQEQLARLFEPFYRTPDMEYSSISGWGLGLTISQKIVERHGGHIWAESSQGNGITLFVKLPGLVH